MKPRIFIDMDGVIVDFDKFRDSRGLTGEQVKSMSGAYLEMEPIPGAIEAVLSLIGMGFEVWLATKPPTGIAHAYSDKAAWVFKHLPELKRRIIITHDKGLLGGPGDYLCDDRPHKANCERFSGTLLRFVDGFHWPQALSFFRERKPGAGYLAGADTGDGKEDLITPVGWQLRFGFFQDRWYPWELCTQAEALDAPKGIYRGQRWSNRMEARAIFDEATVSRLVAQNRELAAKIEELMVSKDGKA